MTGRLRIEKLRREHPVDGFASGSADLDRFLTRYALTSQQANASQTYLALDDADVVGFYTLVVGEVAFADAPERVTKGIARQHAARGRDWRGSFERCDAAHTAGGRHRRHSRFCRSRQERPGPPLLCAYGLHAVTDRSAAPFRLIKDLRQAQTG